jgi:MtrB/PioB family decaheme-associated outer membrane protein
MRSTRLALIAFLIAGPIHVGAQTPPQPEPPIGTFNAGGRLFSVEGDQALVQRYRDLRSGPFLDNFFYDRQTPDWHFMAKTTHVGYRDQQYGAFFNRYGKVKAWFDWNQIPLFYSTNTSTPFITESPGVLRIDDAAQATGNLSAVAAQARPFDLRQRRDIALFGASAQPTRNLDFGANVSVTTRNGQMPWAGTFGFSNAVELAAPLDTRQTDINAIANWGNEQRVLQVHYYGSWFDNSIQTLTWDNPLRITDSPTLGSAQGRMALWPNSALNQIGVTGTVQLPARSRFTAYASVGEWSQNEPLLPFTINSTITPIPLSRPTADAEALVTAANLNFTSRPTDRLWLNARFRRYDFDNQTPEFHVTSSVAYDQTLQTALLGGTESFGYIRQWFDADASYNLTRFTAVRVGYGLEDVERTFRLFEETTEHVARVSLDSTGSNYFTVRAVYEHGTRTGAGLDEEVLDDIGEQISLRQFDISDRDRDRFSAIVQVTPIAQLGVNGTIGVGKDHRPDANFGLQDARARFYTLGADIVPRDTISANLTWGFEKYTSLQRSRQANPGVQFDDPTRDWSTDAAERVQYLAASANVARIAPRTDVQFGYDYNRSRSRYLYVLPVNTTLVAPQQLPPVVNELQRASFDVKYDLGAGFVGGISYWFDKYTVDDFAQDAGTITRIDMPSTLLLGKVWLPYTAHTVWLRVSYIW